MNDTNGVIAEVEDRWYREIVEAAPDATVMIDSNGLIVLVNRQTETLFGYLRSELLGQPVEILVPERYRRTHHIHRDGYFGEPNMREMGAGLELSGVRKDGTEFPVEISLSPVRTDRVADGCGGEHAALPKIRSRMCWKRRRTRWLSSVVPATSCWSMRRPNACSATRASR